MQFDLLLTHLWDPLQFESIYERAQPYLSSLNRFYTSGSLFVPLGERSSLFYLSSVTILAVVSWFARSRNSTLSDSDTELPTTYVEDALSVLAKFVIPTRSLWPSSYLTLCEQSAATARKSIAITLKALIRDIIQGRMELRCPSGDLQLVIGNAFDVDECSVLFRVMWGDKKSLLLWMLDNEFISVTLPVTSGALEGYKYFSEADSALLKSFLSFIGDDGVQSSLHRNGHHTFIKKRSFKTSKVSSLDWQEELKTISNSIIICTPLDFVPRHQITSFITSLQVMVKSDSRSMAYLCFTTCEDPPPVLSDKFLFAALPFMRKLKPSPSSSKDSVIRQRTSSPLFSRLHPILAALSSGADALTIINVQNVSDKYAAELDEYAEGLAYDPDTRDAYMKKVGIQKWREERLYLSWESALLKEGLLTRWVVLLGKNRCAAQKN